MSATTAQATPTGTGAPEIERSGAPSAISRAYAVLLRLTLRPVIAIWAAVSALVIRFGPSGTEMWPVWTAILRATDWGVLARVPRGTEVEPVRLPACDAELVRAATAKPDGPVVLYFHGGGYVACGTGSHRRLVAQLSRATGGPVFNVGYRLLPRSAITHAIEDGVSAYRKLLEDGIAAGRIVFAGDSAGGGLAFLVAVATKSHELPMPGGIVGISPWAELDPTDKLAHRNLHIDPVIPAKTTAFIVEHLIRKGDALDDALSPVNLDLAGLPPTLIHAGTTEVLEADALKLSERLAAAGVPVRLKLWRGQVHDFHLIGLDVVPEARSAIREIGEFVAATTTTAAAAAAR
jgi:acetyl esterase/lipase